MFANGDECNMLHLPHFVPALQLMVFRNARLADAVDVVFEGRKIPLKDHHVVVTMNPGYAGRTDLPNNLQVMRYVRKMAVILSSLEL